LPAAEVRRVRRWWFPWPRTMIGETARTADGAGASVGAV
jgi:hypothetical protein